MKGTEPVIKQSRIANTTAVATSIVCPECNGRVSKVMYTKKGEPFRRHLTRKPDGTKCPHGLTERDPTGTHPAF